MRLRSPRSLRNHYPFDGAGASLYATPADVAATVRYRHLRLLRGRWLIGGGGVFAIGGARVQKTARVASADDPDAEIVFALPAAFASQTVRFDVRTFRDHVENESDNYRTRAVELDANRDDATSIEGTAEELEHEARAGGVVRLRFAWLPSRDGTQPTAFRAVRTAGPTSPADAVVSYAPRSFRQVIEIDTPALSDASAYTYTIRAEADDGAITADVLTGITITADASGPPAPTVGSAAAW